MLDFVQQLVSGIALGCVYGDQERPLGAGEGRPDVLRKPLGVTTKGCAIIRAALFVWL